MVSVLRRVRVRSSTVIATVALVFAMSAGAYAAGKWVITSTKQIKPSVLKQLTGKTGKAGPAGPAGPTGPAGASGAGAQGAEGKAGGEGKAGVNGESVTNTPVAKSSKTCSEQGGAEFKVGSGAATTACNGTTGFTQTLPSGKSEMGEWVVTPVVAEGAGNAIIGRGAISFVIPLATAPTVVHLKEGEAETPECPGSVEEPKATAGFLCLYTASNSAEEAGQEFQEAPVNTFGAMVKINGENAKSGYPVEGTWAVTAE